MANPFIYAVTDQRWSSAATAYNAIGMDINNGAGGSAVGLSTSRFVTLTNNTVERFGVTINGSVITTSPTLTSSDPHIFTQTWNAGGVVFTGLRINITPTAFAATSRFFDLQDTGTSLIRAEIVSGNYPQLVIARSTGVSGQTLSLNYNGATGTFIGSVTGSSFAWSGGAKMGGYLDTTATTGGFFLASDLPFGFSSTTNANGTPDVFIRRAAAATIQQGAADAAAPVAQTFQVQSVVAGTSNTAGANWTFVASKGTGTGAGGSFIFQVAAAGGSGTGQNAAATALTIASDKSATFTGTVNIGSFISISSGGSFGLVSCNGATNGLWFAPGGAIGVSSTGIGYGMGSNGFIYWTSGSSNFYSATQDLFLIRGGAGILQCGTTDAAAPAAQQLRVQSVVAGTSNVAGQNWTFRGSLSTGSGVSGDIIFQTGATGAGATTQNTATTALTIKGASQKVYTNISGQILGSNVSITDGAGASIGTLTNAPSATNPTKWLPYDDNGTIRYIPAW